MQSDLVHPGLAVAKVLKSIGMSVTGTAYHLQMSRCAVSKFLNGRAALSTDMAVRLEKAFPFYFSYPRLLLMKMNMELAEAHELYKKVEVKQFIVL